MKEQIIETAFKQFLESGIREMSVQKLAIALGISTKTFYKHFSSKEDLLSHCLRRFYAEQYEQLDFLQGQISPIEIMFEVWYKAIDMHSRANNQFFADLNYYYPELAEKQQQEVADKFWSRFIEIADEGKKTGLFRDDFHTEASLQSIAILFLTLVREDHFKRFDMNTMELMHNSIAVFIRGLCTQTGIEKLEECMATYSPQRFARFSSQKQTIHS